MKKIIKTVITSLVMFLTLSCAYDLEIEDLDSNQWEFGLNQYFLNHENPNIRIFGLQYFLLTQQQKTQSQQKFITEVHLEFENLFFEILNDKNTEPQALMLMHSLCSNKKTIDKCDLKSLNQKLIDVDDDNITVYIPTLNKAIEANNVNEIEETLLQMSQAVNINDYVILLPEYELVLREY
jgi:hypothetical protein